MSARRRIEIAAYGVDETKQISGTSPFGGASWLGLRVPTLATATIAAANGTPPWQNRYLFLAAAFSVGAGSRCVLRGYRQYHAIGALLAPGEGGIFGRPLIREVTTPGWSFPDATMTTHIRRLGPPNAQGLPKFRPSPLDGLNFRRGFSMQSALLYEAITLPAGDPYYVDLTAYTPPNGGRPYGTPLRDHPEGGTILGLDTEWRSHGAWDSLDLEVEGPDTVCAFVSVAQTTTSAYATPAPSGNYGNGFSPEDQFCINAAQLSLAAIEWTVGCSLIVEVDSLKADVRAILGSRAKMATVL